MDVHSPKNGINRYWSIPMFYNLSVFAESPDWPDPILSNSMQGLKGSPATRSASAPPSLAQLHCHDLRSHPGMAAPLSAWSFQRLSKDLVDLVEEGEDLLRKAEDHLGSLADRTCACLSYLIKNGSVMFIYLYVCMYVCIYIIIIFIYVHLRSIYIYQFYIVPIVPHSLLWLPHG